MRYFKKSLIWYCLIFFILNLIFCCSSKTDEAVPLSPGVKVHDDRLDLSLVVEDPDIVTPIGIAVDKSDRIYVLESHTHLAPQDYAGPEGDLIKIFEDSNGDGTLDSMRIYAEGINEGMNMAFSPEGHLYLVTSTEVWVYYDRDEDGVSEESEKLLELTEPQSVYPHAALLSITFSNDGWMYIGRGNTGGIRWRFEGTDGSEVSGYGDGGNVMRARLDGTELEEFATGFWNPFDLKFDDYGRLMVADNDPDSRGPNRLLHTVRHGDYGYKSIFGGSGIHPYSSWNGELPGTLPYAVPLGEAPSGLLNASLANLPQDYQNQMLCTIWEESTIVRINFQEDGISVSGDTEVIVSGGEDFRPVAFATDSRGNVYFTDWVLREYPNHGKGKIWKLTAKNREGTLERRKLYDAFLVTETNGPFQEKRESTTSFEEQLEDLKSNDPFVVHKAIIALSKIPQKEGLVSAVDHSDPNVRLGILLALRKSGDKEVGKTVTRFLIDPEPKIRNAALIWAGTALMTERRNDLELAITSGETSTDLFETYLETVKLLQPEFVNDYKSMKEANSKSLNRVLPENFISSIVKDPTKPKEMRVYAMRYLDNLDQHKELLISFLDKENDPEIRLEVIFSLRNYPDKQIAHELLQMALDQNSQLIRSEALLALSNQPTDDWKEIIPLLEVEEENVALEAARFLRSKVSDEDVRKRFEEKLNSNPGENLKQQLMLGLNNILPDRPDRSEEKAWQELLAGKGDVERGRRVFYSNTSLCSGCHAMEGRGGDLGPDLSNVGKSKDRNQLISSLFYPSAEISPEWQGWFIKLKDGTLHQGRQIDVGGNSIKLYTQAEGFINLDKEDIESYGMIKESLMPEGLEKRLSDQDIRDLLTYLGVE